MKRCMLLMVIATATLAQSGCGDGVAYSRCEREARHKRFIDNDFRQLTDDWDYLWLMEEQSHLSKFKVE